MESKKRGTEKMTPQIKVIGKCIKCGWEILQKVPGVKPDPPKPGPVGPKKHVVWVDKFTGKEKSTKFSASGDNPQFKRFKAVAFGYWPGSDKRYVYNTKYVNAGKGHVEYHPGLTGRYQIKWYFRKTKNRAKKACNVRLVTSKSTRNLKAVSQYAAKSNYASIVIGTINLTAKNYITCAPGDRKSIAFGKMIFSRVS